MMEAFFQAHVLPEFKSPHGFLRYRVSPSIHYVRKERQADLASL